MSLTLVATPAFRPSSLHQALTSLLSIPKLPVRQRKIWRDFFDYYVFQIDQDPAAHLPADLQDIIGNFSPERKKRLMELLSKQLASEAAGKGASGGIP